MEKNKENKEQIKNCMAGLIISTMRVQTEILEKYYSSTERLREYGFKKPAQMFADLTGNIKNHLLLLQALLLEFDGGIPTGSDGVNEALSKIRKTLSDDDKQEETK